MDDREIWDQHYRGEDPLPWDTNVPDEPLLGPLTGDGPIRVLEIGCGTGTNAVWLASRGHRVVAVDIAPAAVARARNRAAEAGVQADFQVVNILSEPIAGGPFDLIFDRGCFHVFDEAADRASFAERVAALLAPGGRWLSVVGSTEGPPRDYGPPRRSLRDLAEAVEPWLALHELQSVHFDRGGPREAMAWRCLWGRRDTPAQPSTRH